MKEKWTDVIGLEGLYRVSSFGRVRSVTHVVIRKNDSPHTVERKYLKSWNQGRYQHQYVGLYIRPSQMKVFALHRIVLESFVGPCPKGMQCRHLDGNPQNNRLDNLAWGTPKQNMNDREKHGRHARGSKSGRAKLTEVDIPQIRLRKSSAWGAMSKVAREFKVDTATIRDIWCGRTWLHVT